MNQALSSGGSHNESARNSQKYSQADRRSPAHKQFVRRTLSVYSGMVRRFAELRDKNGRVRRYFRQVPFTLEQFREWVLEHLGGSEAGAMQCPYCGTWISALTFVVDHNVPVDCGGTLGFENLTLVCETCNDRKGMLTGREFLALLRGLETFSQKGRTWVLQCMGSYVKLAARDQARRMKQQKGAVACSSNSSPVTGGN